MVFLEGNHSEPEIVSEKVLLSVPPICFLEWL